MLWLRHTLEAERETQNRNRVIITMDQLMDDWEAALGRVQRAVGVPWPVPVERSGPQVSQFLDPGKRHHRVLETADLSPWTCDAHEGLVAGAHGDEAKMRALLDRTHAAFDTADALYWPVIRTRSEDLERRLGEATANYTSMADAWTDLKEKYRVAKEKLAAKSTELTARKDQLRQFERSPGGKLTRLLGRIRPKPVKSDDPVHFPSLEAIPNLSIIVSIGKDLAQTARCLRAVRDHTPGLDYEVLAVGTDTATAGLHGWKNIVTVSSGHAAPFGEPHNRAALAGARPCPGLPQRRRDRWSRLARSAPRPAALRPESRPGWCGTLAS